MLSPHERDPRHSWIRPDTRSGPARDQCGQQHIEQIRDEQVVIMLQNDVAGAAMAATAVALAHADAALLIRQSETSRDHVMHLRIPRQLKEVKVGGLE